MRHLLAVAALLAVLSPFSYSQYYPRSRSSSSGGRQAGGAKDKSEDKLLATFTGVLKGIDKKSLLLEADGGNEMTMYLTKKSTIRDGDRKLAPQDLKPGTLISVEAKRFPDGSLDAVNVRVEHPKQQQEQQ